MAEEEEKPVVSGSKELDRLKLITDKKYKDQAIWFLNAHDCSSDLESCELVWKMHKKFVEYDADNGEDGSYLSNEIDAQRVLEHVGSPLTQIQLRKFLGGIKPQRNFKTISLVEVIFCYFSVDNWKELVMRDHTCSNQHELEKAKESLKDAKAKLKAAMDAKNKSLADAADSQRAMERANKEEDEALEAENQARKLEKEFVEAKEKAEKALEELKSQEEEAEKKASDLEKIVDDITVGNVKRQKAKVELSAIKNEDPLPLRSAKLNNEAAVKKLNKSAENSRMAAEVAISSKEKAKTAKNEAEVANQEAIEAADKAREAIPIAKEAFKQLREMLVEMMSGETAPRGAMFYIDREMKHAEKYIPRGKLEKMRKNAESTKFLIKTSPPRVRLSDISIMSLDENAEDE